MPLVDYVKDIGFIYLLILAITFGAGYIFLVKRNNRKIRICRQIRHSLINLQNRIRKTSNYLLLILNC